jgi:hypothetical protein
VRILIVWSAGALFLIGEACSSPQVRLWGRPPCSRVEVCPPLQSASAPSAVSVFPPPVTPGLPPPIARGLPSLAPRGFLLPTARGLHCFPLVAPPRVCCVKLFARSEEGELYLRRHQTTRSPRPSVNEWSGHHPVIYRPVCGERQSPFSFSSGTARLSLPVSPGISPITGDAACDQHLNLWILMRYRRNFLQGVLLVGHSALGTSEKYTALSCEWIFA